MVRNSIEALVKATEGQSSQRSSLADCRRTVSELNNANSFYVGIGPLRVKSRLFRNVIVFD